MAHCWLLCLSVNSAYQGARRDTGGTISDWVFGKTNIPTVQAWLPLQEMGHVREHHTKRWVWFRLWPWRLWDLSWYCCCGESGTIWVNQQEIVYMCCFFNTHSIDFIQHYLIPIDNRFSIKKKTWWTRPWMRFFRQCQRTMFNLCRKTPPVQHHDLGTVVSALSKARALGGLNFSPSLRASFFMGFVHSHLLFVRCHPPQSIFRFGFQSRQGRTLRGFWPDAMLVEGYQLPGRHSV